MFQSEELSEEDADTCYQSAPEYNQVNLPFLISIESSTVLETNHEMLPPCPVDRVAVECDSDESLESASDNVKCPAVASIAEHSTETCKRLPGKSKQASIINDCCRPKQVKLDVVSC